MLINACHSYRLPIHRTSSTLHSNHPAGGGGWVGKQAGASLSHDTFPYVVHLSTPHPRPMPYVVHLSKPVLTTSLLPQATSTTANPP